MINWREWPIQLPTQESSVDTENSPEALRLEAQLDEVRQSPRDKGLLRLIVRRPEVDAREVLERAELNVALGLVGDNWSRRGSARMPDGSPHPDMQLNLMNSRAIAMLAGSADRWALAGDQLFVDLDLSPANLPPGTRLTVGEAEIEITSQPHTGCAKFSKRFGVDALRLVNSPVGRSLNLRGVCARVTRSGTIRQGDRVLRVKASDHQRA